jgi:hypothetical protein
MTTSRSEDVLIGFVALVLVPLIGRRIWRGLREGRLPLYRTYLSRDAGAAKFNFLLLVHVLSLVLMAAIAADLLFDWGLRGTF